MYETSQLRSIITTESHDTNFQYYQSVTEINKRFHLKSVIYQSYIKNITIKISPHPKYHTIKTGII